MNNINFLILSTSEINKIDFDKILETSSETLRKSLDNSKTVITWEGTEPSFVSTLTTKEGPYDHSEILNILRDKQGGWFKSPV